MKTWQKEELLVMSIFSIGHNVFKCHLQMHQKVSARGKGLNFLQHKQLHICYYTTTQVIYLGPTWPSCFVCSKYL